MKIFITDEQKAELEHLHNASWLSSKADKCEYDRLRLRVVTCSSSANHRLFII
ncbi:hypothetical protein OO184_19890 [Photorhabdus sp. APURE]|uniref:hypothetical protein n=1 Tax=Photorhabdus aballayi TaxID=2991723 RepID=UPI00223E4EA5|nr:hypothetical protein [Photorhabdus aballayi]MCW7550130.1 hypothetical protein [Photorhabdus aballayi]